MHLWAPDVYQGAPAPVTAFIATVSKGAVMALLLRYYTSSGFHASETLTGALAVIETDTVASNIRAAELALKGTPVELVELRLADSGLSGKGVSIYQGELPDIEAAVEIVVGYLRQEGGEVRHTIVSSPHEALARQIGGGTSFGSAALLDLDGEVG